MVTHTDYIRQIGAATRAAATSQPLDQAQAERWNLSICLTLKRICDVVLSMVGLLLSFPFLLLIALIVSVDTRTFPIFRQRRVGAGGREFTIFKFRTMRSGSEWLNFRTEDDDPRITVFGKFLRDSNIDELPQMVNILRGEMSVIGPRPLSVVETEHIVSQLSFSKDCPGLVPQMLPGLIGLEQLSRERELTYFERFELNYAYENNWTPSLDFVLFFKGIHVCRRLFILVASAAAAYFSWASLICRQVNF